MLIRCESLRNQTECAIFSTKQNEYLLGLSLRKTPFLREVLDDDLTLYSDERQSPGWGGGYSLLWALIIIVCAAPKGMVFQPFWSGIGCRFWSFWSLIASGFCTLVLNWVCFSEEATFSSLSIRSSIKAFHKLCLGQLCQPQQ